MIPVELEKKILSGNASFETYQSGFTEYNVIPVRSKEYIVILGYNFQPAGTANYRRDVGGTIGIPGQVKVPQKIEFFDGQRYNHFIHRMEEVGTNASNLDLHNVTQGGLYMVYKRDCGIAVTVPLYENYDWSGLTSVWRSGITNVPDSGQEIIFKGTNNYGNTTATGFTLLAKTEGATGATNNTPTNRFFNSDRYSENFEAGPIAGETNQFNFNTEPGPVTYNANATYASNTPADWNNAWYLNVQYVRVFQEADENLR
jgi:hypothetical protein